MVQNILTRIPNYFEAFTALVNENISILNILPYYVQQYYFTQQHTLQFFIMNAVTNC